MRVGKARQKGFIDIYTDMANKKKALEASAGRLQRCWGLLKKLLYGAFILFIIFSMAKPTIYKKMGWEMKPLNATNITENFEEEVVIPGPPPP